MNAARIREALDAYDEAVRAAEKAVEAVLREELGQDVPLPKPAALASIEDVADSLRDPRKQTYLCHCGKSFKYRGARDSHRAKHEAPRIRTFGEAQ